MPQLLHKPEPFHASLCLQIIQATDPDPAIAAPRASFPKHVRNQGPCPLKAGTSGAAPLWAPEGLPYLAPKHLQLLLLQAQAELLAPCPGLLLRKLGQGEAVAGAVARGHAQGAAAAAGHAGEALAPREVEDGDAIEDDSAWALPGSPLQDGRGWKADGEGGGA